MVRKTAVKKPASSKEAREEHTPVPQENGKPGRNAEIAQEPTSAASKEPIVLPAKSSTSDEEAGAEITDARGTKKRRATSRNASAKGRKFPSKASTNKGEFTSSGQEVSENTKNGSLPEKSSRLDSNAAATDRIESTSLSATPDPKAKAAEKAAVQEQASGDGSTVNPQPSKDEARANPRRSKKTVQKLSKDSQDERLKEVSELIESKERSTTGEIDHARAHPPKLNEQHQRKPDREPELLEHKETSVKIKANIGKKTSRRTGKAKQEQSRAENSKGQLIEKTETDTTDEGPVAEPKNTGRKKTQSPKQNEQSQGKSSGDPKQPEDKETSLKGKADGDRRAPKRTAGGKQEQLREPGTRSAESQKMKEKGISTGNEGPEEETAEHAHRKDPPKRGKKRGAGTAATADDQMEDMAVKKPQRAPQKKKVLASSKTDSNTSPKTHAGTQQAAKGGGTKRQKNATKAARTGKAGPSLYNVDTKEEDKEEPSRKRLKGKDATATGSEVDTESAVQIFRSEETSKPWNIKICSWNVNGVRSWLGKGSLDYLKTEDPDILAIQETKCADAKLPKEIKEPKGYHAYFIRGDQEGYSGVGLLSKVKPVEVKYGIGIEKHDKEGRVITAEYEKFFLVATYVPNAGRKLVRLEYRMEWDKDFCSYLQELERKKPVVLCGDLNVAHQAIDLANPKTNRQNAGFTDEEREGFTTLLSKGFLDSFRHLYPDATKAYTFWTYMMNARAKDVGWRLDYFVLSKSLEANLCDSIIQKEVMGSDHCPIKLLLNM